MTFDNEFLKDLTERFSDYMDEDEPESGYTSYVKLRSVNVDDSPFDSETADTILFVINMKSLEAIREITSTVSVTSDARQAIFSDLGEIIYLACDLAHRLGCNDLSKYVYGVTGTEV